MGWNATCRAKIPECTLKYTQETRAKLLDKVNFWSVIFSYEGKFLIGFVRILDRILGLQLTRLLVYKPT